MNLPIKSIRRDGGAQCRSQIYPAVVEDYAYVILASLPSLPPIVAFYDGAEYWLADGFHRVEAAILAGLDSIDADIRQGTQRDAILFACGANGTHGLRRTNAEKRTAVLRLMDDAEWSQWSNGRIAGQCGVSSSFVDKVAKEDRPDRGQVADRLVKRGDTVYTQKAAKTERKPKKVEAAASVDEEPPPPPPPPKVVEHEDEPEDVQAETTDEDYLRKCPAYAALEGECHDRFRGEAIYYRRTTELRHELARLSDATSRELKLSGGKRKAGPFRFIARRYLNCPHPADWIVCPDCKGSGAGPLGRCNGCYGEGYLLFPR